jgi:hypothetical protein
MFTEIMHQCSAVVSSKALDYPLDSASPEESPEVTKKSVPSLAILSRSCQKAQVFPSDRIACHQVGPQPLQLLLRAPTKDRLVMVGQWKG